MRHFGIAYVINHFNKRRHLSTQAHVFGTSTAVLVSCFLHKLRLFLHWFLSTNSVRVFPLVPSGQEGSLLTEIASVVDNYNTSMWGILKAKVDGVLGGVIIMFF